MYEWESPNISNASLNKNKFIGIILPAVKTVSYQFIVFQLQIHPSFPWFVILQLDPINIYPLPAGLIADFDAIKCWGDTARPDQKKVLSCLVVVVVVFCFLFPYMAANELECRRLISAQCSSPQGPAVVNSNLTFFSHCLLFFPLL